MSGGLIHASSRINRNIVECKVICYTKIFDLSFVLIETLWNVKVYESTAEFGNLVRINRNIVECKVASGYTKLESDSVLIETLWNVKLLKKEGEKIRKIVLIETLWSVKDQEQFFT